MAALRSGRVNLRVGPGVRYPVDWVLVHKHLPVLVFTEFDDWRRIKLQDGTIGWVLKKFLTSRPYAAIQTKAYVMPKPGKEAGRGAIALLMPGVVVSVCKEHKSKPFVKVRVCTEESEREVVGWVPKRSLWMHDIADMDDDATEVATLEE